MPDTTPTALDEMGPLDYLVVEFPAGAQNFSGEMADELAVSPSPVPSGSWT